MPPKSTHASKMADHFRISRIVLYLFRKMNALMMMAMGLFCMKIT